MVSNFETTVRVELPGARVLVVTGELDLASADEFVAAVTGSDMDEDAVLLDLAGVTFMDSTGLAALITVRNSARDQGRRMVVESYSPAVARVLELAGLADLFLDADEPRG